jgi:hypothetical protein
MNRKGKAKANASKKAKAKIAKDKAESPETPVIDQAFFEYTTVHAQAAKEGFVFSAEKFQEAIKKRHKNDNGEGILPTRTDSIPGICKEVPPDEVLVKV